MKPSHVDEEWKNKRKEKKNFREHCVASMAVLMFEEILLEGTLDGIARKREAEAHHASSEIQGLKGTEGKLGEKHAVQFNIHISIHNGAPGAHHTGHCSGDSCGHVGVVSLIYSQNEVIDK